MKLLRWLFELFNTSYFSIDPKENKAPAVKKRDYRLKPGCQEYYFNKHGRDTGHIVFQCIARNIANANRKFNNYKASLS